MCWASDKLVPHVADKPIRVFKILWAKSPENCYNSLLAFFPYKLDKLYELDREIGVSYRECYEINEGFHSYSIEECMVINEERRFYIIGLIVPQIYEKYDVSILEFEIPEGATYYLNTYGQYVSNRIIPRKVIAEWDRSRIEVVAGNFVNNVLKF